MFHIGVLSNYIHLQTDFNKHDFDMNLYPNVLTPPMDSPSSMLSPGSESRSPPHLLMPNQVAASYGYNADITILHTAEPYLRILEQPVDKFRFRYKSEMSGTHGSLNGKTSDRSRKQTFPSVELMNYDKPAVIRCSLYQFGREDMAFTRQLHAHRLVKKQGNEEIDDPHDIHVSPELGYVANFHSMGIIHTAKKYIVPELIRKNTILKQEDIARTEHKFRSLTKKEELEVKALAEKESKCINLNVVCLRFDVFRIVNNIYYPICMPIYSHGINNLKSALTGDLKIVRMDHCSSSCRGGREIFILVEKVTKKNIKVRFFELDDDDNEIWSDYGRFSDLDVHHQYAIVFKTPPYKCLDIDKEVRVFIELQRPSDGARSEPKDFSYVPCDVTIGKKRTRFNSGDYNSSYFSIDELPVTLNSIAPSYPMETGGNVNNPMVNSEDLEAALRQNNIDSSEFDKLCNSLIGTVPMKELFTAENLSVKELKNLGLVMDTANTKKLSEVKSVKRTTIKEEDLVKRVQSELNSFMCTNPTDKRKSIMLQTLVQGENYVSANGNSVLHLLASKMQYEDEFASQLVNLISSHQPSLLNVRNMRGQTPLHVATESCNKTFVEKLIQACADVTVPDMHGNTLLHVAVLKSVSYKILELILRAYKKFGTPLDPHNTDGKSPLHLAIKTNNLNAVKLLVSYGANVNVAEKKRGHTALHLAILDHNIQILNFLLSNTNVQCDRNDFGDCNPLQLAKVLIDHHNPQTHETYDILENHMKKNGTFHEGLLTEAIDSTDEENDELTDDSNSDLTDKYTKLLDLTEECKNYITNILDKSGTWKKLAELLDCDHLISNGIFTSMEKPTKSLLNFAIANGESIKQIRDYLDVLQEAEAVQAIDNMVINSPEL